MVESARPKVGGKDGSGDGGSPLAFSRGFFPNPRGADTSTKMAATLKPARPQLRGAGLPEGANQRGVDGVTLRTLRSRVTCLQWVGPELSPGRPRPASRLDRRPPSQDPESHSPTLRPGSPLLPLSQPKLEISLVRKCKLGYSPLLALGQVLV
jgi:hypothetical protein